MLLCSVAEASYRVIHGYACKSIKHYLGLFWTYTKVDKCSKIDLSQFKPPVEFNTKVMYWPGQVRAGQAKTELMF